MTLEAREAIYAKGQATWKINHEKRESEEQTTPLHPDSLRKEVVGPGVKLFTLRDIERMSAVSVELTTKTLLMPHEIAAVALPWKHVTSVYFPLDGDEAVYAGQSLNVYSRTSSYPVSNFNCYAFVPCAVKALDKLESLYTHLLHPKLNGGRPDGPPFIPLTINSLIGSLRERRGVKNVWQAHPIA